jgi:hypothetical protein
MGGKLQHIRLNRGEFSPSAYAAFRGYGARCLLKGDTVGFNVKCADEVGFFGLVGWVVEIYIPQNLFLKRKEAVDCLKTLP